MKHIIASALLVASISFPAFASSIELIDNMVTGPKGTSSIVTLGPIEPCGDVACTDATGGDPKLVTLSSQQQIASLTTVIKKINFEFARKFPDPAVPVPTAPSESASSAPVDLKIPTAPADSGTIAAQPPIQPQPGSASIGAPIEGAPADAAAADGTRGSIDPNARIIPVVTN